MKSKKATKRALLSSALSLVLCFSMLLGTTFAWFTDSASTGVNIIKSGTLDVEMYYSDTNSANEDDWNNANEAVVFNYKYWEPGYTDIKYIKIQNVGNLAFKFQLNIIPEILPAQGDYNLADVIDVYLIPIDPADPVTVTRASIDALEAANKSVGTLSELMADPDGAAYGVMLPTEGASSVTLSAEDEDIAVTGEATYCIALKMQEDAGNDYQNLSVGEGFRVQLLATQYTWENDSFDNMYDKESIYDALPNATVSRLNVEDAATILLDLQNNSTDNVALTLDTAYAFKGESAESAEKNLYADWFVDFFVSLDKDPAEGLVLAGQYDQYLTDWIAFYVPTEGINAGEFYPLLGAVTDGVSNWKYTNICSGVGTFNCGAVDLKGLNDGTTLTVQLRLINPENTDETVVVKSVEYTFGEHAYTVFSADELVTAIENGITNIALGADITNDVTVAQQPDVEITIDGNGHTFASALTVDGKSATYITAGLTVKNMVFKADSISADACINLGVEGDNNTRYTCNVTVENCTFDVPGAVGVKSYTGGDKNLTITGCTVSADCHSLVQAKGIDGILVKDCKVYSKNGLNFNNSDNVTVDGCVVDVKGYAVRFGESSGGTGAAETYFIKNCTLKSANDEGDATIILRGTADYATLTIENTTIVGDPAITKTATDATVVNK